MANEVRCKKNQWSLDWAGTQRNRYLVRVPVSHDRDDVLSPDYLGDVMGDRTFTVGDIVEYEWEDFSRFIECQVRAQVPEVRQCLTVVRFEPAPERVDVADGDDIEWRGGAAKHVILFAGKEVKGGFESGEAAAIHANWLAEQAARKDSTRRAVRKTSRKPRVTEEAEA